ncbi:MAG: hypothetical protein LUE86_03915 [Clostridiales bacterium]|nr:hypothetical protein [Clostridiales bacterium]
MEQTRRPTTRSAGHARRKKSELPHILVFYILPYIVFNVIVFFCVTAMPEFDVDVADTQDYLSTTVTMNLQSHFPTRSVTMTLNGEELELEKDGRTYTAIVTTNGSIEATVVNVNGMTSKIYDHVNVLDETAPTFDGDPVINDGVIYMAITDSQSGVNFDSIYALNSLGETLTPLTVDRSANTLSFEMDPDGLRVCAQDMAGNEVQANFTSHSVDGVETLEGGIDDTTGEESSEAAIPMSEEAVEADSTAESDSNITIN